QSGLMILAGILALIYPVVSSFAAVFLLGCVLIVSGIVQGISLIDARDVPHFWLQLVSVVLSVIVGVLLIRHRAAGLLVLTLLLLVFFMVEGISKVIFSLTILAAWRIAWHSAHLRRGRSWLFGLAGADKLTPVPASVRARQSRPALPANRHAATPAARCRKCRRGRFIFNLPLSSQHSITPSAANSSLSGTRRPRSPAVGALTTNSNFAACPTGRSAGFSPLRIRPV